MNKVTRRNNQIRQMRRSLKDLADFLGDAKVSPPLPLELQKWIKKEVSKV